MNISLCGETLELLPEKAFYWPRHHLLGLSDVHLGKADSLQTQGLPIPSVAHVNDLNKMKELIHLLKIKTVIILGDFIHDRHSWSQAMATQLAAFFHGLEHVKFKLIMGNHEKGSLDFLKALPIELISSAATYSPFTFTHGHLEQMDEKSFEVSGHVHPVVVLKEGSTRLRLPCFVVDHDRLLIPSFGELTGGYEIKPKKDQKIFAVAGSSILSIG